jgi:plastocyanin
MRLLLALIVVAFALAGCGGDDSSSGGGGGGSSASASSKPCASDAVVIKMANIKFDPAKATAKVGQAVCWENDDTVDHDASATSGASFKSDLFSKGQTFTTTVDKAGTVKYVCTIHPGMTGEIDVKG